jgi:flavin-dependent dehydrogenase
VSDAEPRDLDADLVVVGGGPAGLATAIGARLAGLEVTVLDRARPPIDKACGEGLMPDAVAHLRALGIELAPAECFPFRGIRYVDGLLSAEGVFPRAAGLGVRRLALHQAMVRRAEDTGVRFAWGTAVKNLPPGPPYAGVEIETGGDRSVVRARWIVAADGLRSRLREQAGLARTQARGLHSRRFGVRRHFALPPWSDFVEVHWGPSCEAYVTPVSPEQVGIALLWSGGPSDFDTLLACFPALQKRVAGAPVTSRDRGAGPLLQRVRGVRRGNLALVGDAAGYLDAITGEGLAVAFHESAALVSALRAADLAPYSRAWRRINRLPNAIASMVLFLERRPRLRSRAIRALAAEPALFSRLLGIHARALPARGLGIDGALRLAWRLVA